MAHYLLKLGQIKKAPPIWRGFLTILTSYCKTTTIVLEADFPVSVIL